MQYFNGIFLVFLFLTLSWTTGWSKVVVSPYDVSYLLPLPEGEAEIDRYLNANQLVGTKLFQNLNQKFIKSVAPGFPGMFDIDNSEIGYKRFLALAYRLDPCFQDVIKDECRPQVRITLQSLTPSQYGFFIVDGAVHLFFDFSKSKNWNELLTKLMGLNREFGNFNNDGYMLGVHPNFQGNKTDYQKRFQELLLSTLSKHTSLKRIAFMSVEMGGIEWHFQTYNRVKQDVFEAQKISKLGDHKIQSFINELDPDFPLEFNGQYQPLPPFFFKDFLADSRTFKNDFASTTLEVENAQKHLPGMIDCLSCHVAPAVRSNLEEAALIDRSRQVAEIESSFVSGDFIMFGYKGRKPFISKRILNETLAIIKNIP